MEASFPSTLRVVPAASEARPARAEADVVAALLRDPRRLRELVDAVVDRIERQVVDELERRGHRHSFGAF